MSGLPERTGLVSCRIVRNDFGENLSHIKAAAGYTTIVVCLKRAGNSFGQRDRLSRQSATVQNDGSDDNTTFDGLLRH
jgi:hypothetical protein